MTFDNEQWWYDEAECKGISSDIFFLDQHERTAKSICEVCTVTQECLDYALETGQPDGIWGGKTIKERKRFARARKVNYNNQPTLKEGTNGS